LLPFAASARVGVGHRRAGVGRWRSPGGGAAPAEPARQRHAAGGLRMRRPTGAGAPVRGRRHHARAINLCDPSCADGPDVHENHRWNGTTYVLRSW